MKLSLKEFFVHEAKSSAQPSVDERKLSSYEHPRTHLHSKFAKDPNIEEPWALAQHIASKNEHQDPTCTAPDAGSTIWSDPTQPADVRKFSNRDGNLHVDLQEMFGVDEMGGPGSGRKPGSKNKPTSGSTIPGKTVDPSSLPDELPDDFGVDIDTSDFDEPAAAAEPDDAPFARTAGDLGDESDLSWLDDPNLGQGVEVPKQDPNAPKPTPKPPMASPDYEGQWQASPEHQEFLDTLSGSFEPDEPKDKGQFWRDIEDEGGEAMSWDELKQAEPDIAADIAAEYPDIADPGTFMDEPGGIPRERQTFFAISDDGDIIMRSKGERFKWDPENAGWIPMDDGETPSGEF